MEKHCEQAKKKEKLGLNTGESNEGGAGNHNGGEKTGSAKQDET